MAVSSVRIEHRLCLFDCLTSRRSFTTNLCSSSHITSCLCGECLMLSIDSIHHPKIFGAQGHMCSTKYALYYNCYYCYRAHPGQLQVRIEGQQAGYRNAQARYIYNIYFEDSGIRASDILHEGSCHNREITLEHMHELCFGRHTCELMLHLHRENLTSHCMSM